MTNLHQQSEPARVVVGRRLAAISAAFIVVVSLLMATTYYRLKDVDPRHTPALQTLTAQLERDAANAELRQQVRELDWLARRAFFVRQWQIQSGAVLLIVAGLVLAASLHLMASGRTATPHLQKCPGADHPWAAAARARRVIAITGVLVLAAAAGVSLLVGRRGPVAAQESLPVAASAAEPKAGDARSAEATRPADPAGWPQAFDRQWPSFRGPRGLGVTLYADPPTAWDGATGTGILWKAEVPRGGFNSPVVWDNHLFLTGADAQKREVYCYDATTGALLWTADTEGIPGAPDTLPEVTADTGYAAPSVAVDGERVVAIFGTGDILGLDYEGRRLWARHLATPGNHYGHSSSLLILHKTVFVQFDHTHGSALKALDVETGRDQWETSRQADISWASPILAEVGGRQHLILAAAPLVAAYDALTGKELWSRAVLSGEIGSSPAYANGRVFAANQYACAVALDALTGETIWSHTDLELPDAGSPVATDTHLFLPTSYGTFSCVAAADGSVVWEHDFDEGGYGSPILAGDRIYWVTADGKTRIFKASDTFALIAEPALGEASVCTPALVGRRLYIRGVKHLFCIGPE